MSHWCAIGSANCMWRTLYTDIELSVGILDAGAGFVKRFRRDLWTRYCGLPLESDNVRPDLWQDTSEELLDITKALGMWDATWGATPADARLLNRVGSLPAPQLHGTWTRDVQAQAGRYLLDELSRAGGRTTPGQPVVTRIYYLRYADGVGFPRWALVVGGVPEPVYTVFATRPDPG